MNFPATDSSYTRVVVVACGAQKAQSPQPAGSMYTGAYHRQCRRAAAALVREGGRVLILSAKYGLVCLEDSIEPYDLRMGAPGSITVERMREQAQTLRVTGASVIALGSAIYVAAARGVWPKLLAPLEEASGMGYQMKIMAGIIAGDVPEGWNAASG